MRLENSACRSRSHTSPSTHRDSLCFLHSSAACAQKTPGLKGGRVKIEMGQDLANPTRWSHLSFTFSVCSVGSRKMPEASLRCPPPPPRLSPARCLCRERHVTPSFPSIAMTKYPRQPMYQEEGFIWEHSFRGLNLQSMGPEAAHHDGQCMLEKAAKFIVARKEKKEDGWSLNIPFKDHPQ